MRPRPASILISPDRDFEVSDVIDYLQAHYEGATREQMVTDVGKLIESFRQSGVLQ